MKTYLFILTLFCVVTLFVVNSAADADGLIFITEASFVATQHSDLGTPLGGLGVDPVAEKVEILARYIPNATRPLTIFEFEGGQASFGSFVRDFSNSFFAGPEEAFPAMTVDSVHGVAYFLQDQGTRIVINPRHLNPRNPPTNDFVDFIVNETGPVGITYDEWDDTLIILLHSDSMNSGQQLIRILFSSGIILSRTPLDATLAIDRDSEVALNPTTGNYFVSVGSQVFEVAPDGIKTGRSFSSPNGQKVMGMEFGTDNQFVILELDGTVSVGTLISTAVMTAVTIDIRPVLPSSFPNLINPNSKQLIPVAIVTTDTFDATLVDPLSVRFGPNEAQEAHGKGHLEDVNKDGEPDLVLRFRTQATGIQCGDPSASLTGETFDRDPIQGSDSIKTVGCKK